VEPNGKKKREGNESKRDVEVKGEKGKGKEAQE
jgi:hypothetical protein